MTVSPGDRPIRSAYRVAEVKSFDDLKALGVVPAHIREKDAAEAILSDSRRHREVVRLRPDLAPQRGAPCNCGPSAVPQMASLRRRDFQDSFAELVQRGQRVRVADNSPLVLHPYYHIFRWMQLVVIFCPIFVFENIDVADGASLTLAPGPECLFAGNINLGSDSGLLLKGGAVHVSCLSLNGPSAA